MRATPAGGAVLTRVEHDYHNVRPDGADHGRAAPTTRVGFAAGHCAAALAKLGVDPAGLIIAIESDINRFGEYSPQWLVASNECVWVFDQSKLEEPLLSVVYKEAEEFRTIAVVGSGMVQAKIDGAWLDLIRYSNRRKYIFGRAAKRLDQIRSGGNRRVERG